MAFAIWVPTRLWMGDVVSPKRDMELIQSLADKVRQMALCRSLLLAVDGFASYVSAFRNAFRSKLPYHDGETGRCKLISWQDIAIVQVDKQHVEGVFAKHVEHRIVQGTNEMVVGLIEKTQGRGVTPAPTAGAVSTRLSSNGSLPPASHAQLGATNCNPNYWHVHCRLLLQFSRLSSQPALEIIRWVFRLPLGTASPCHHSKTNRPSMDAC